MGEYTPNLNLYKPKADFPAERGWGTKYNEAMDILDGCAKKEYVDGLFAKVFPYRPETWPTEEISWGDGSSTTLVNNVKIPGTYNVDHVFFTASTPGIYNVSINVVSYMLKTFRLYVNDTVIYTPEPNYQPIGSPAVTKDGLCLNAGDTLRLTANTDSAQFYVQAYATVVNTGKKIGPKTFNLTGKWLALGIDMKGLAATVKIQGVEMPYSDYVKCFPLAPSELTIPGGWDVSQVRPAIKAYNI